MFVFIIQISAVSAMVDDKRYWQYTNETLMNGIGLVAVVLDLDLDGAWFDTWVDRHSLRTAWSAPFSADFTRYTVKNTCTSGQGSATVPIEKIVKYIKRMTGVSVVWQWAQGWKQQLPLSIYFARKVRFRLLWLLVLYNVCGAEEVIYTTALSAPAQYTRRCLVRILVVQFDIFPTWLAKRRVREYISKTCGLPITSMIMKTNTWPVIW